MIIEVYIIEVYNWCPGLQKMKSEKGFSLLEVLIAMVIMAIIVAALAFALITASKTLLHTDTKESARNFAEYEMELIKSSPYSDGSYAIPTTLATYPGLTASYALTPIHTGLEQEVTVTVTSTANNAPPCILEGYKVK
jgi:prepilin-type N-terminal cleavage/methylation domain-containing protein